MLVELGECQPWFQGVRYLNFILCLIYGSFNILEQKTFNLHYCDLAFGPNETAVSSKRHQ